LPGKILAGCGGGGGGEGEGDNLENCLVHYSEHFLHKFNKIIIKKKQKQIKT